MAKVKKVKNIKDTKLKMNKESFDTELSQIAFAQGLKNVSNNIDMIELEELDTKNIPFAKIKEWKAKGIEVEQYGFCVKIKKSKLDNNVPNDLPNSTTPEMVAGMISKSRPLMEDYTDPETGETYQRQVILSVEKTRMINKFVTVDEELRPVWIDSITRTEYTIMSEDELTTLIADESKSMRPAKVEETFIVQVPQFETYEEGGLVSTENTIQMTYRQYLRGIVEEDANKWGAVGSLEYLATLYTVDLAETLEKEVVILSKQEYSKQVGTYRPDTEI